jgi:hypothetical protein
MFYSTPSGLPGFSSACFIDLEPFQGSYTVQSNATIPKELNVKRILPGLLTLNPFPDSYIVQREATIPKGLNVNKE